MITTLAWDAFGIVSAPLAGVGHKSPSWPDRYRLWFGCMAFRGAMQDTQPPDSQPWVPEAPRRVHARNNVSRNIISRYGWSRLLLIPGGELARPSRCHRSQDPEGTAGRRPHDQCRAVAPGRHFGPALLAPRARAGGGRLHQGLPRAARREEARLRGGGVRHGASGEPGGGRPCRLRGVRARTALGARMLDALGRDRLRAQMRRARLEDLPGLRREAHRRAQCAQREDLADAAQFQGRGHGADGAITSNFRRAGEALIAANSQSLTSLLARILGLDILLRE